MVKKLDLNTKKECEEKTITSYSGNPTEFLANKCRVLESIESLGKLSIRVHRRQVQVLHVTSKSSSVSHAATVERGKCYFL